MDTTSNSSSAISADNSSATGNAQSGTFDSEDAEETQDEEPSTEAVHSDLDDFRRLWKREIEMSPSKDQQLKQTEVKHAEKDADVPQVIEEQARSLFLCGVQAERSGLLEKAISFYRRAVQLVPDIEFRVTKYSNDETSNDSFTDDSEDEQVSDNEDMPYDDDSPDEFVNLLEKLQKANFNLSTSDICMPKVEQQAIHISILPPEIFIYILKWLVSSDLDLLSLEQVSKVCRGFYLCARDSEIWRLACLRIWEMNICSPNRYGSWRNMYIQRPHLLYNGTYISKTTYIRYGEPSFQDTNYRPCYLVSYFRYLRFFPDGLVLMLTTPEDPYQSLFKLRYRKPKHQSVFFGRYKLVESTIMAVLKKPKGESSSGLKNFYRYKRQQANLQEVNDQTFHLELELRNVKKRTNCQLIWKRYSIHMVLRNGQETVSDFNLNTSNFPPFWFSRVKSYTAESESPLM